jgi:hypothetical protein
MTVVSDAHSFTRLISFPPRLTPDSVDLHGKHPRSARIHLPICAYMSNTAQVVLSKRGRRMSCYLPILI